MERGLVVRPAEPRDADAIAAVHVASWRAAYDGIVPRSVLDRLSVERRAAFWRDALGETGGVGIWVADEGSVVGFASSGAARDEDLEPRAGEVQAIYLLPEAWGQGIGRALLEAATVALRERGLDPLVLWVLTDNDRGRRFYERQGWRPDGSARSLDFDGTPIEELRYRRSASEAREIRER